MGAKVKVWGGIEVDPDKLPKVSVVSAFSEVAEASILGVPMPPWWNCPLPLRLRPGQTVAIELTNPGDTPCTVQVTLYQHPEGQPYPPAFCSRCGDTFPIHSDGTRTCPGEKAGDGPERDT